VFLAVFLWWEVHKCDIIRKILRMLEQTFKKHATIDKFDKKGITIRPCSKIKEPAKRGILF